MLLSFAPMEGLTTSVFRRIHAEFFPGTDRYYAPFLAPDGQGRVKAGAWGELLPERNAGLTLVPQILCNTAEAFLSLSRELAALGYREVNLNMGCPSATVVPKHKGAGMLLDLLSLDHFLNEVFSKTQVSVSVKCRLGLESTEEFPAVLEILNAYPLTELILHARDRKGLYQSTPDLNAFRRAFETSRAPLAYNGNVLSPEHFSVVMSTIPRLEHVMIGRGAIADPALFRQLRGGKKLDPAEFSSWLEALFAAYLSSGIGEYHSLGRMKELWYYVNHMFPGADRECKRINKARSAREYREAVSAVFSAGYFDPDAHFPGAFPAKRA